jgi:hypothetical protein
MCKEMPVIPVSKVVDPKKNNRKKWRAKEEEERHKGSLTPKNIVNNCPLGENSPNQVTQLLVDDEWID